MLNEYPIYFDDTEIFTPESWDEDYSVVESTSQTEAGTDQVIVIRYDKLTVSCSFQCSSKWAAKFSTFRDKPSIIVKMYDLKMEAYKERTMRIRKFKSSKEKNSEKTLGTNGLYTVSFELEEF